MKFFKKFLCTLMVIVILTLSVGSSYLDSNHMTKVHAVAEVIGAAGITAASLFEICLFVGGVIVTCYAVGEIIENEDDIARIGKNAIDKLGNISDQFALSVTDASGQVYQIGSQALKRIQEMDWQVIQGGKGNHDDDSGDKGSGGPVIDFPLNNKTKFQFSAWFATMLASIMKDDYKESLAGNPGSIFEPIMSGYVTDMGIAAQWSGEPFMYSAYSNYVFRGSRNTYLNIYDVSSSYNYPLAAYFSTSSSISFISKENNVTLHGFVYGSIDGAELTSSEMDFDYISIRNSSGTLLSSTYNLNFPLFSSESQANSYLNGTFPVINALNYAKVYQNADWLSDNWAGQLVDPLTNIGLSLSQLLDLMKALGLNAVGNNLSPEELLDMIKEALPAVNPDLLPDHVNDPVIEPDPDKDPIYYPYPGAWPDPGTNPNPNPGTDPDDPSGGGEDNPGNDPDIDRPNGTWVVDLSKFFPFCIPFDLIHLLNALDAEPQAPRFEFPLKIPAYGVDYTFVIDLAMFNTVAVIFRTFETLLFILGLILLTRHLIRG